MDFFYPNYINDMWRVMGLVFFGDRLHFVDEKARTFRLDALRAFLLQKGIALYDTATAVRRLKDNASDKYLEITARTDIAAMLRCRPTLQALVTTGQKATDTLLETLAAFAPTIAPPVVGGYVGFGFEGRSLRFYRMPSTSRAYPLALDKKASCYAAMFRELGMR